MQTTFRFLLGATAAGTLLAGCSTTPSAPSPSSAAGSTPASAGPATGGDSTANLSCNLAPSSLVGSALGVAGVGVPREMVSTSQGAECIYTTATNGPVTIIMFSDATAAKMSTQQQIAGKGEHVTTYSGFEDQAFSTSQNGVSMLAARKGSVQFTVTALVSVSAEKSLEEQLFARIG